MLPHSLFGPYCCPPAQQVAPYAHCCVSYFVDNKYGDAMQWFMQRSTCLKLHRQLFDSGSQDAGFCVACTFTDADLVFNGLHWKLGQEDSEDSFDKDAKADLEKCFAPRPQQGKWFPRVQFKKHNKEWNIALGSGAHADFIEEGRYKGTPTPTPNPNPNPNLNPNPNPNPNPTSTKVIGY